ncbi:hypothetical protein [Actinomadura sp. 7K507]|uniref:hypothetical protein n=1 Tax=Actinomadura sp. 7K507 TaxID=2530365 RepID=UPI0010498423|nr:hypothetical protein [Actinomadura sp. 7K507]TDC88544.1 hypothetical protein E1285_18095 [Actinomadura sp. 7K507]
MTEVRASFPGLGMGGAGLRDLLRDTLIARCPGAHQGCGVPLVRRRDLDDAAQPGFSREAGEVFA